MTRVPSQKVSMSVVRADNPHGPGRAIGAIPFVGPNGELYVAWNDYAANTIAFSGSLDGGATFSPQVVISPKTIPFDAGIPAEFSRRALVYPACDTDRSAGPNRGRLYCSWMDVGDMGTDIFLSTSDEGGATWSAPRVVGDVADLPEGPGDVVRGVAVIFNDEKAHVGPLWVRSIVAKFGCPRR